MRKFQNENYLYEKKQVYLVSTDNYNSFRISIWLPIFPFFMHCFVD